MSLARPLPRFATSAAVWPACVVVRRARCKDGPGAVTRKIIVRDVQPWRRACGRAAHVVFHRAVHAAALQEHLTKNFVPAPSREVKSSVAARLRDRERGASQLSMIKPRKV